MNNFVQNLFKIIFPFYPFWAWFFSFFTNKGFGFFFSIFLLPIAIYLLTHKKNSLPKYLCFFILFTIYHITSAFINNTIPASTHWFYFIFSDINVLGCIVLTIVEITTFEKNFIAKMNQYLFLTVIVSLIVSVIQIRNPLFFFNVSGDADWGLGYIDENRNFSIYSWINYHSLGMSFPILVSILISEYNTAHKSSRSIIVFLFGFIVCFLSRYRFAMISAIIVSSQMIFTSSKSFLGKLSLVFIALSSILLVGYISEKLGFKIEEVISNRILETDSDMASANARLTSYNVFFLKFPEHPWFGVGPETRDDVLALLEEGTSIIHVGYLSYLYYYGVFGALLLFISLFCLLQRAWIVGKTTGFWGSFYGLLAFCIANLSFVYFDFSEMGIVIALIYLRYYNCKSSLSADKTEFVTDDTSLITNKAYLAEKTNL
jgi:hypothetical protein